MVINPKEILNRLEAVRTDLLKAAAECTGRSPDRWRWDNAQAGWVQLRELHDPHMSDADRQRFSRTVRRMIEGGQLEPARDSGGRVMAVRVPMPVTTRKAKT